MNVLLVDDEKEFVTALSERLNLRGIRTNVVFNGREALDHLQEHLPDVIVLDLRMPGLDGMEVLRQLRKDNPNIRVVVLSGYGTEHHRQEAQRLNALGYFRKPANLNVLLNCIVKGHQH